MSRYSAGAILNVIPKDGEGPEPVFAFQPNPTHMHSLSQEQHTCNKVRMEKDPKQ